MWNLLEHMKITMSKSLNRLITFQPIFIFPRQPLTHRAIIMWGLVYMVYTVDKCFLFTPKQLIHCSFAIELQAGILKPYHILAFELYHVFPHICDHSNWHSYIGRNLCNWVFISGHNFFFEWHEWILHPRAPTFYLYLSLLLVSMAAILENGCLMRFSVI